MDDIHSDQDMIVAPGNVPAFLFKLWSILENPAYETLISWNQVKNFILHQISFWNLILEPLMLNSSILDFSFFLMIAGHYIPATLKIWYVLDSKCRSIWILLSVQWFLGEIQCWIYITETVWQNMAANVVTKWVKYFLVMLWRVKKKSPSIHSILPSERLRNYCKTKISSHLNLARLWKL